MGSFIKKSAVQLLCNFIRVCEKRLQRSLQLQRRPTVRLDVDEYKVANTQSDGDLANVRLGH